MLSIEVRDELNSRFNLFNDSQAITVSRRPLASKSDEFFLMGSCFAEEIRIALAKNGVRCSPSFHDIEIPEGTRIDELPARQHMNFYNTFTVLQEVEKIAGIWDQPDDDFWKLSSGARYRFQDPYRRLVMANTVEDLNSLTHSIDRVFAESFARASAFVFTFGMAEVFRDSRSGRIVGQKPAYYNGGGASETVLHRSSFSENLANIQRLSALIETMKPGCPIFVTVSPVPLQRTFSEEDVFVTSFEGKCILRAALGEAARSLDNVHYFPSFEFVTAHGSRDGYIEDGRHVRRELVEAITEKFLESYLSV